MITELINGLLDYPIEPLPQDLLAELPRMKKGQRIVAIRKARGIKQQIELRKRAKLAIATCSTIETRDIIPSPKHLFAIAAVLQTDPLLIIFGRPWEKIFPELTDAEKMFFLRLRKGWTQLQLAQELEKSGLVFNTKNPGAKRSTVAQWEIGKARPAPEKITAIRKVLADDGLFQDSVAQPVLPKSKPKPTPPAIKPAPQSTPSSPPIKIIVDRQAKIDVAANEALTAIQKLATIQSNPSQNLESHAIVVFARRLIKELRQLQSKDELEIVELELNEQLAKIKQAALASKLVPAAPVKPKLIENLRHEKVSFAARHVANRTISALLRESPGKSIIQILPILVRHQDWNAVRVAVDRIEINQEKKLQPEDRVYLIEVKSQIPQTK